MGGVIGGIISSTPVGAQDRHTSAYTRFPRRDPGMILRRVQPVSAAGPASPYPGAGGTAGRDRQRRVDRKLASDQWASDVGAGGHEAIKQWKYKPYILNGEPVEVETTITFNFTLSGG